MAQIEVYGTAIAFLYAAHQYHSLSPQLPTKVQAVSHQRRAESLLADNRTVHLDGPHDLHYARPRDYVRELRALAGRTG